MIENNKHIAGSGGGGGKGGGQDPPTITPDNLHSKQFATLLDLIIFVDSIHRKLSLSINFLF